LSHQIRIPKLIAMILGCEAAGGLGALVSGNAIETWYPTLRKPSFNPPNWIFGPVWTLLFALMGVALYLVSETKGDDERVTRLAKWLFALQLGLNVLWSGLFFGLRSPFFALIEIVFLWIAILLTILAFARISRTAALLLLPYLAWTTFAAVLNVALWRLNRDKAAV
jgi:translocator protein